MKELSMYINSIYLFVNDVFALFTQFMHTP